MHDIAIIGAGPGGYISAIKAAQLGATVVLIEKDAVGGTCLNRGCIPSKTLLAAADKINEFKKFSKFGIKASFEGIETEKLIKRKDITILKLQKGIENLLKSYENITVVKGEAQIIDENSLKVGGNIVKFKHLITATGCLPLDLPHIKRDGDFILNSDDILSLKEYPSSILIVGSGAIGIEWARIFISLGIDVSIVDIAQKLSPASDYSLSEYLQKEFKQNKIKTYLDTGIEKIDDKKVYLTSGEILEPEKILLATGRKPDLSISQGLNIETEKGFVKVNENFQTNIPNIYAIGDINGIMQLAHVASHQGICAVKHILQGENVNIDYDSVPFVIYGKPEIASVGITEKEGLKISVFPMSVLGKSLADDEQEGFVKLIAENNILKGAHIVAKEASSLIHVLALAIKEEITLDRLEEFVFAHPTYSEGIYEALLGLDNKALHLPNLEAK